MSLIERRLLSCILVLLALLFATSQTAQPTKRDYNNKYYYAIEVLDDSFVTPQEIASLLDIEWEGQIGELVDHHLFSSFKQINEFPSKRSVEYDRVLDRFNTLKQKRSYALNGLSRRDQSVIDSIVAIDKQVLRKRHKRWPIPPPVPKPSEDEKTEFSLLGIEDPGFVNQWHLVCMEYNGAIT